MTVCSLFTSLQLCDCLFNQLYVTAASCRSFVTVCSLFTSLHSLQLGDCLFTQLYVTALAAGRHPSTHHSLDHCTAHPAGPPAKTLGSRCRCVCMCVCACVCTYGNMCVCMCACVSVWVHVAFIVSSVAKKVLPSHYTMAASGVRGG